MSNEIRGSEKLMKSCTTVTTLEHEDLDKVVGGALSLSYSVFPRGIPWPEVFKAGQLGQEVVSPAQLGQVSYGF